MEKERVPELDGLRGLAVLMVVSFHYVVQHLQTIPASPLAYFQKYLMFLWAGVDVFFVLSGYLLGGILLDQQDKPGYLRVFYLRRTTRIIPSYLLLLVCYVVASIFWRGKGSVPSWLLADPLPFWPYALFVQNIVMAAYQSMGALFIVVTWSLAVEEQFYLVSPILIGLLRPKLLPYGLGVLIVAAPLFRLASFLVAPENTQTVFLLPARCDSLLLGVLAAWAVRDTNVMFWLRERFDQLRKCFIVALAIALTLPILASRLTAWSVTFVYFWIAVTVALLVVCLTINSSFWIGYCLRLGALRYLGKISYTLYLFHLPVLGIIFALVFGTDPILATGPHWLAMGVAFALSVGLAQLTWSTFEAWFIGLGHRFHYGPLPKLAFDMGTR